MNNVHVLACDIGGTKTDLAIFSADPQSTPMVEESYASKKYPDLESILHEFLAKAKGLQIEEASFSVAGPVVNRRASTTNLPWVVDERLLPNSLGVSTVHVLDDLVATAYYVPHLREQDLRSLNDSKAVEAGTIGVIAPGTGLGEAFSTLC